MADTELQEFIREQMTAVYAFGADPAEALVAIAEKAGLRFGEDGPGARFMIPYIPGPIEIGDTVKLTGASWRAWRDGELFEETVEVTGIDLDGDPSFPDPHAAGVLVAYTTSTLDFSVTLVAKAEPTP